MDLIAALLPDWPLWALILVGIILSLALLIFVLVPLLMLILIPISSNQLTVLAPLDANEQTQMHPFFQDAASEGFSFIGHFSNSKKGLDHSIHSLALSQDQTMLLRIERRRRLVYCSLNTRYSGEHWLITRSTGGASPDLSGLDAAEVLLNVSFPVLLEYHLSRLRASGEHPTPFLPESLPQDLMQHEREQVQRMVDLGFAHYKSDQRAEYKYTFKAALRFAAIPYVGWLRTRKSLEIADRLNEQAKFGLLKQRL
jgi:hypothetical protein